MDAKKANQGMNEVLELQKLEAADNGMDAALFPTTLTFTVTVFWSTVSNHC